MEWSDLAKTVIGLGAPLLGEALGGPLGAAAGKILATALDAGEATPAAVDASIAAKGVDSAAVAAAARQAEAEFAAALADIGKAQVIAVGETQRAEMASADRLQRVWRPLYALELSLIECPAFALTLLHALWTGFQPAITGFADLSALLMAYFGARFGVLGVYVSGRSKEKRAALTGDLPSSAIDEILKLVKKKK